MPDRVASPFFIYVDMTEKHITTSRKICVLKRSWKFADNTTKPKYIRIMDVQFEINQMTTGKILLNITPNGLSTAKYEYDCMEDCFNDLKSEFNVDPFNRF